MGKKTGTTTGSKNAIDIAAQLAELQSLPLRDLHRRYQELFGEPTKSRNKPYLVKKLGHRIQELAEGGLSGKAKKRIAKLSGKVPLAPRAGSSRRANKKTRDGRDPRLPESGTVLTRTYKDAEHMVTVLADGGFEYNGQTYSSLSRIAREITGTSWNGWVFFGLVQS
ncbi:MAG: DUF2924 domain-containing protein [Deltaproteobacteria bacterium]|nr:DUF2924 domain-containing protein [Deltaproteobacteria bacterium]